MGIWGHEWGGGKASRVTRAILAQRVGVRALKVGTLLEGRFGDKTKHPTKATCSLQHKLRPLQADTCWKQQKPPLHQYRGHAHP